MLNISDFDISNRIDQSKYKSLNQPQYFKYRTVLTKIILILLFFCLVCMFLPWTQNISSYGKVTTLEPDKRPQEINSIIAGKVEKWYIREGKFVRKGDTIIHLSEVRDDFFDPNILTRMQEQLDAKLFSLEAYGEQVSANEIQVDALKQVFQLRLQQAFNRLKQAELTIQSDSIRYAATITNFTIAQNQLSRALELLNQGIISHTEAENRKRKFENEEAKMIDQRNQLSRSKDQLSIAQVEINAIKRDFENKIAKAQSAVLSASSNQFEASGEVAKSKNQFANINQRSQFHYILAPQNGYVTQINKSGIGEIFTEGEPILTIMPSDYELAVEMYVNPIDIPLIEIGRKTRIVFDGWPSIIFSGWPNVTFGTFGGEIVAIDRYISPNGKYRVMVAPDDEDVIWPNEVNVGSGAQTITLLNNVPIWWELWRLLNGFPDNYYEKNPSPLVQEKVKK